jgi:hypothetical protein
MAARKRRLTVTVDAALLRAATEAVARGREASVSAWVNGALADRHAKERRLTAMAAAIAHHEAELGVITEEEIAAQRRADRRDAIIVSPRARSAPSARRKKRAA